MTTKKIILFALLAAAFLLAPQAGQCVSGNPVLEGDDAVFASIDIDASATPTLYAKDSDAPGADKDGGNLWWDYIAGADGAENFDFGIKITQGGVEGTSILVFDESDNRWEVPTGMKWAVGAVQWTLAGTDYISSAAIEDGSVSGAEFKYLGGVTSDIQTQLDAHPPIHTTLAEPDQLQPISDAWKIAYFPAETFPSGVTIDALHITTSATCTDALNFEEWTQGGTTASSTVEAINLSGTFTEDDGALADASIAADGRLMVDLPASPTDIAFYEITVIFHAN